jgi:hypothetical protein
MKKGIILLILLISVLIVQARSIDQMLNNLESYEVPGHNLTLIGVSANKDSIAVCINNQKYIINKNQQKEIGDIMIEPIRVYENSANIRFTYSNSELTCGESCSNAECFNSLIIQENNQEDTTINEIPVISQEQSTIKKPSNLTVISIGLMILAIILILIFFSKKKR